MLKLFLIVLVTILFGVLLIGGIILTSAALTFAEGVLTFLAVVFLAIIPGALLLAYCYRTLKFTSKFILKQCKRLVDWICKELEACTCGKTQKDEKEKNALKEKTNSEQNLLL